MTVTNYVVPHAGFGDPRHLTVDNVNPDLFLELLAEAGDSHEVTVTLCGHSSSGFRVRHDDTVVGVVSAAQSADYGELDWVMLAGLSPQVTARVSLCLDCEDDTTPVVEVLLPEPGLCVPSNNPPADRWHLLEGDTPLRITDFEISDDALSNHSAHLLVRVENKRGLFQHHIQVFADTTLIATIPYEEAEWLAHAITNVNREDLVAVTRAYYSVDNGTPTLTLFIPNDTTSGSPFLKTAGALAAATAGAAVAAARAEANGASSPTPFVGASPSPHSPVISLNSMDDAASTASFGSKFAAASTGLKLASAASVAIIIGGTANFAASLVSLNSSQEHITGSALEVYNNPHINPRAADDENTADSTGVEGPEWSEKSAVLGVDSELLWDGPSPLRDVVSQGFRNPSADESSDSATAASGRAADTTALLDVPRGTAQATGAGAAPERNDRGAHREGRTSPTSKATEAHTSPRRTATQDAPRRRERLGAESDSAPIRDSDSGAAATAARPTRQAQPKPSVTRKPTPTAQAKPTPPKATTQPAPTTTSRAAATQPTYAPQPRPTYVPYVPQPTPSAPTEQDRSTPEEGQVVVPFVPTLPPHGSGTDEPAPEISEDVTVIPAAPLEPAATVEPSTPVSTPQEPTPVPSAAEEPTPVPSAAEEPTPAPSAAEEPTPEIELTIVVELTTVVEPEDDEPSPEPHPLPQPEVDEPATKPGKPATPDKPQWIPPGQLKKMERESKPSPASPSR
ncbi:hypothetical protein [Corynebacterium sp. BF-R-2]|uniref:hypothetical protein n=1 Tax=Corynebacterium sp. BF-R-2 TaxID=2943494 RepID=UPI00211E1361|nr:hypothetical protein [Corynebacterium sp. BF-R-2]MCQ9676668.1 hypothetical protein [Corynebacterium sp. BF-R-2]